MAAKLSLEPSSLTSLLDSCTDKLLLSCTATEADSWAYDNTAEGVEVWKYSPTDKSPTNGLARGTLSMNVSPELAWRFFMDARNNVPLDSFCSSVELVQEFGPELSIYRIVYSLPWPIASREFIIAYKCCFVGPNTRLTLFTTVPEDFMAVSPGAVRAESFGGVVVKSNETDTSSCQAISVSSADLKGYLPSYITNAIINRRPYVLSKIRAILESKDPIQTSKCFFIEESKIPKL